MKEIDMQQFDGTQPDVPRSERVAVTERFDGGIESLLSTHEDFIDTSIYPEGGIKRNLTLLSDGVQFDIFKTNSQSEIRVNGSLPDGKRSLVYHTYSADEEGTVRRLDMDLGAIVHGDTVPGVQVTNLETGKVMYKPTDSEAIVETVADRARVFHANRPLARQLGVNEQPVTLREIDSVLEVAEGAEVPPVSGRELDRMTQELFRQDMTPEEEAREAGVVFDDAVRRTLVRESEAVSLTDKGQSLGEVTSYPNGTWRVEVTYDTASDENGSPFVGAQWTSDQPAGTYGKITLRYGLEDGQFIVSREHVSEERLGPHAVQSNRNYFMMPAGIEEARVVRNFLRTRTLE